MAVEVLVIVIVALVALVVGIAIAQASLVDSINKAILEGCPRTLGTLQPFSSKEKLLFRQAIPYCQAAYYRTCNPKNDDSWVPSGWTLHSLGEHGFVVTKDAAAIAAFRGTNSVTDAITDMRVAQVDASPIGMPGKVHSGYFQTYMALRTRLKSATRDATDIYVTGHSMGAALALLAAIDMGGRPTHTACIAPPKVGDETFAKAYLQNFSKDGELQLLINNCDFVPISPTGMFGGLYFHPSGVEPTRFTTDRGSWRANHSLGLYRDAAQKLSES